MLDGVFRTLAKAPQRRVLCALAQCDGPIDLETLGEETVIDAHRWTEHQIALYHIHLPELDDEGFIDWDRERRVIETGAQFEEVRPFVEILNDDRDDENGGGSSYSALSSVSLFLR